MNTMKGNRDEGSRGDDDDTDEDCLYECRLCPGMFFTKKEKDRHRMEMHGPGLAPTKPKKPVAADQDSGSNNVEEVDTGQMEIVLEKKWIRGPTRRSKRGHGGGGIGDNDSSKRRKNHEVARLMHVRDALKTMNKRYVGA